MPGVALPSLLCWSVVLLTAIVSADYNTDRYDGVSVSILSHTNASSTLSSLATSFNTLTGAQVSILSVPSSALASSTQDDLSRGSANLYQSYLTLDSSIYTNAAAASIAPLTDAVGEPDFTWYDVLPALSNVSARIGTATYSVPLSGLFITTYYRRDLFTAQNLSPPNTWDEYVNLAQTFHGQDLNGDGVADYGSCIVNSGDDAAYMYYAVVASYLQYKTSSQGIFFNVTSDGMYNNIDNAGVRKAFSLLYAIKQYAATGSYTASAAANLFASGRCALMWTWSRHKSIVSGSTYVRDKVGVARIPGSLQVLSSSSSTTLVTCTVSLCPYASALNSTHYVNRPVTVGNGGVAAIVNAYTTGTRFNCVSDFWAYVSNNVDTYSNASVFTPVRASQFLVSKFVAAGYAADDISTFVATALDSLRSPSIVLDLRISNSSKYHALITTAVADVFGAADVDSRVTQLAAEIETYLDENGRYAIETEYRKSLGLSVRVIKTAYVLDAGATAFLLFLVVCAFIFLLFCFGFIFYHRHLPAVANSNIWFLLSLCFGGLAAMVTMTIQIIQRAWPEDQSSLASCKAQPVMSLTAFVFLITIFVIKSYYVLNQLQADTFSRHKLSVTNRQLLRPFAIILIVEVVFAYLLIDSYEVSYNGSVPSDPTKYIVRCVTPSGTISVVYALYHYIWLIAAVVLAYKVSNRTSDKGTLYESLGLWVLCLSFAISIPIGSLNWNPSISICFVACLAVAVYVGPVACALHPKFLGVYRNWSKARKEERKRKERLAAPLIAAAAQENADAASEKSSFSMTSPIDTATSSAPFTTPSFEKDFRRAIYSPWLRFKNASLESQYKLVEQAAVFHRCGLFMKLLVPIVFAEGWIEYAVNSVVDPLGLLLRNMAVVVVCLAIYGLLLKTKTQYAIEGFLFIYAILAANLVMAVLYNASYTGLRIVALEFLLLSLGVFVVRRWLAISLFSTATQAVELLFIGPALQTNVPLLLFYVFACLSIIVFNITIVYSIERESRLSFFLLESFLSSERRWRHMMEVCPDAVLTVTSDWHISYANPTAYHMLALEKFSVGPSANNSSDSSSSGTSQRVPRVRLTKSHLTDLKNPGPSRKPISDLRQVSVDPMGEVIVKQEYPNPTPKELAVAPPVPISFSSSSSMSSIEAVRNNVVRQQHVKKRKPASTTASTTSHASGEIEMESVRVSMEPKIDQTGRLPLDDRAAVIAAGCDARLLFTDPRWVPLASQVLFDGKLMSQVELPLERSQIPNQGVSWMELNGSPIEWKGNNAALILARDVTQRKKMESLRSRFLAAVSHELRTPLNAILGMLEIVTDMQISSEVRGCIDIAARSSRLLLNLINEILDLSKMESDKLTFNYQPFDIRALVKHAIELVSFQASHKNLDLDICISSGVPSQLVGDAGRITQIMLNLLSNAIKFTTRGFVRLSVDCLSDGGSETKMLRVEVADSGVGIRDKDRGSLFQLFGRLDDSNVENPTGSGLGLAISKQLCQRMGGDIVVSSEYGVGSTFVFTVVCGSLPNESTNGVSQLPISLPPFANASYNGKSNSIDNGKLTSIPRPKLRRLVTEGTSSTKSNMSNASSTHAEQSPLIDLSKVTPLPTDPTKHSESLSSATDSKHVDEVVEAELARREHTLNILVVEDNLFNFEVVRMMLCKHNVELLFARNGLEGVQRFESSLHEGPTIDIILMDCDMPIMNGYDSTRGIRKLESEFDDELRTPIVGMTAFAMEDDRTKCMTAGMDDYLTKPVTKGLLWSRILHWLRVLEANEQESEHVQN